MKSPDFKRLPRNLIVNSIFDEINTASVKKTPTALSLAGESGAEKTIILDQLQDRHAQSSLPSLLINLHAYPLFPLVDEIRNWLKQANLSDIIPNNLDSPGSRKLSWLAWLKNIFLCSTKEESAFIVMMIDDEDINLMGF